MIQKPSDISGNASKRSNYNKEEVNLFGEKYIQCDLLTNESLIEMEIQLTE